MMDIVRRQLCPTGVLRAGINMSNFLLVTARDSQGQPGGVSPDLARAMADRLEVPLSLLPYPGPGQVGLKNSIFCFGVCRSSRGCFGAMALEPRLFWGYGARIEAVSGLWRWWSLLFIHLTFICPSWLTAWRTGISATSLTRRREPRPSASAHPIARSRPATSWRPARPSRLSQRLHCDI